MTDINKKKLIAVILAVIAVIILLIWLGIFWWTVLGLIVLFVVLLHFSVTVHIKASRAEGVSISAKYLFLTLYPRKAASKPQKPGAPPEQYFEVDDLVEDYEFPDGDDDESTEEIPPASIPETAPVQSAEKSEKEDSPSENATAPADEEKSDETDSKPQPDKSDKSEKEDMKPEKAPKKGKLAALKEKFEKVKPYIPIGWKAVKKFCKAIRFEGVDVRAEVGRFDAHEAVIYYGIIQGMVFDLLGKIGLFFTLKLKRADVRYIFGENKLDGAAELTVRVRPSTLIAIAFCTGVKFLITYLKERRKRKKAARAQAAV